MELNYLVALPECVKYIEYFGGPIDGFQFGRPEAGRLPIHSLLVADAYPVPVIVDYELKPQVASIRARYEFKAFLSGSPPRGNDKCTVA